MDRELAKKVRFDQLQSDLQTKQSRPLKRSKAAAAQAPFQQDWMLNLGRLSPLHSPLSTFANQGDHWSSSSVVKLSSGDWHDSDLFFSSDPRSPMFPESKDELPSAPNDDIPEFSPAAMGLGLGARRQNTVFPSAMLLVKNNNKDVPVPRIEWDPLDNDFKTVDGQLVQALLFIMNLIERSFIEDIEKEQIDQALTDHPLWKQYQWMDEISKHTHQWNQCLNFLYQYAPITSPHFGATLLQEGYLPIILLGQGVNGAVIKAFNVFANTAVAIKLTQQTVRINPKDKTKMNFFDGQEKAFVLEVVMQDLFLKAGLSPMIYDVMQFTNGPSKRVGVMVMDLIDGNLENVLKVEYEKKENEDVSNLNKLNATVVQEMKRLLKTMSDHNLVHADLKPDNIAVTMRNGQMELQVLDLGWAYVNHRSRPWPEMIWFSDVVLIKKAQALSNRNTKVEKGFANLWDHIRRDTDLMNSFRESGPLLYNYWNSRRHRFSKVVLKPNLYENAIKPRNFATHESFVELINHIHPYKQVLDQIMMDEHASFQSHCAPLLTTNANAVHRQRVERLTRHVWSDSSPELNASIRDAKQCIRRITSAPEKVHQYQVDSY